MNTYVSNGECSVTDGSNIPGHTAQCSDDLITVVSFQPHGSSQTSPIFLPTIFKSE
jgi:hypothetical protein